MSAEQNKIPDKPSECPICTRVAAKIKSTELLHGKLTENEIEQLITEIQNAVLKKNDNSRGNKMANDQILINKANFDELYEAQKYLLLLVEKMADKMEKNDQIMTAMGIQLQDVIEKAEAFGMDVDEEAPEEGGEEKNDIVLPGAQAPAEPAAPVAEPAPVAPLAPAAPAPAGCPPCASAPVAPAAPVAPEMEIANKSQEFKAGYNVASVDAVKKNGVSNYNYPEFGAGIRPVSAHDVTQAAGVIEKSMSEKQELGTMKPHELNARLRQMGLLK